MDKYLEYNSEKINFENNYILFLFFKKLKHGK